MHACLACGHDPNEMLAELADTIAAMSPTATLDDVADVIRGWGRRP